jgi:hypothetical protein
MEYPRHGRVAGIVATLFKLDPSAMTWSDLSSAITGPSPPPRYGHGFAAAGGKLYVHAGWNGQCEHLAARTHLPSSPLRIRGVVQLWF